METPRTHEALRTLLRDRFGLATPGTPAIAGHAVPFEYLAHAVLGPRPGRPRDALVWANRGGGKTFLGALATALDLVFKPGVAVRILAGSLEQAGRMHAHLRALFEREHLAPLVSGRITERRLRLTNGSAVELLAASQASVRGTRVQILRCDEADLFDPRLWEAAQLVTRSADCGGVHVEGAVECYSTMHRPHGLMARLVDEARAAPVRTIFRWGVADVLGVCDDRLACDGCPIHPECGGRAKTLAADLAGHIDPADAIAMKRRVSLPVWNAEMLCLRPRRSDAVYPAFDRATHTFGDDPAHDPEPGALWIGGMDFGFRAPTVVLIAHTDSRGVVRIVRERAEREVVLADHARAILDADGPALAWIGADPAGHQRSGQTGRSDIQVLRDAGLTVRARPSSIEHGVRLITSRLSPAQGSPTLLIHRRCTALIDALERYHYPEERPESREPVKDGPDHAADALRYMIVNLDQPAAVGRSSYA